MDYLTLKGHSKHKNIPMVILSLGSTGHIIYKESSVHKNILGWHKALILRAILYLSLIHI